MLYDMAKKISFKLNASQNAVQLLIVMAGVFLGMLLTEWNASRKSSNKVEAVIKQIKVEILANKKMLESSIEHKRPFWQSMDSLEDTLTNELKKEYFYDKPFNERLPGWKGMGGGRLNDSMYETAKFSNVIPEMDIELVKELSSVYNTQRIYNNLWETFLNRFYKMNDKTTYAEMLRLLWLLRQELGGYELKLLNEYNNVLEKLEDEND